MNKLEKENRIGRFNINYDFINDEEIMLKIMSKMIIVKCEHLYHKKEFEYFAYSELFNSIPFEYEPPEYIIKIEKIENDIVISAEIKEEKEIELIIDGKRIGNFVKNSINIGNKNVHDM